MRRILILFLSFYTTSVISQNVNYSQILVDMLMRDECFQAWDYKQQYSDSIAKETELIYNYKMNGFLNRPDSSAIYLERIFDECPAIMPDETTKLAFFNNLIGLYSETENYIKLVETYDRIEQFILTESFSGNSCWKEEQLALLNNFRLEAKKKLNTPKIGVARCESDNYVAVSIQKEPFITTLAECNGISLRTIVDTGFPSYLFVSKANADKCQFREIPSLTDSLPINGVMARANWALADSIRIGNVLFTNIPVFVLHDKYSSLLRNNTLSEEQVAKYDSLMSISDAIIGLSLLQKLGCIEFDWEKSQMNLKTKSEIPRMKKEPNMYIKDGGLYTHLLINGIDYTGILDTGANTFIELNQHFYESNSANLPIDPNKKKEKSVTWGISVSTEAKTAYLLNPQVTFDSKVMKHDNSNVAVVWFDDTNALSIPILKSGGIGNLFIKRLGKKVKFDFVNMRIVAE